jgi:hypothetical protein
VADGSDRRRHVELDEIRLQDGVGKFVVGSLHVFFGQDFIMFLVFFIGLNEIMSLS